MLGIPDIQVLMAYLLSILAAILCIVYGIVKWNSDT
ncbi:MAG: symporter small accessory protein [Bacillota bacterium]